MVKIPFIGSGGDRFKARVDKRKKTVVAGRPRREGDRRFTWRGEIVRAGETGFEAEWTLTESSVEEPGKSDVANERLFWRSFHDVPIRFEADAALAPLHVKDWEGLTARVMARATALAAEEAGDTGRDTLETLSAGFATFDAASASPWFLGEAHLLAEAQTSTSTGRSPCFRISRCRTPSRGGRFPCCG